MQLSHTIFPHINVTKFDTHNIISMGILRMQKETAPLESKWIMKLNCSFRIIPFVWTPLKVDWWLYIHFEEWQQKMQETRNNCIGSKIRSTTLRQAKKGKHECRNITATYTALVRKKKSCDWCTKFFVSWIIMVRLVWKANLAPL